MSGIQQILAAQGSAAPPITYISEVLADAPAGFWLFDETSGTVANDSSGNGRNGAYVASPTLSTGGVSLNGTNQCVTVPDTAFDVIGAASQAFTFELFVTILSGISSPAALVDKTNMGTSDWNLLQYVSGDPHFQLYDGSSNPIFTAAGFTTGVECMIHAVRDIASPGLRLFKDGVALGSGGSPATINAANTIDLCFGARQAGTDRFAKIKIRRAAVYLTRLPDARIAAHYAARNL